MSVKIEYVSEMRLVSFYVALDTVAKERSYLLMIEAPAVERIQTFQQKHIKNNWPNFLAVKDDVVIGWIDVTPNSNTKLAHRGSLGMGILKEYRGQGIGKSLLESAIKHSKLIGLEKIELYVYSTNIAAIELYKKYGFKQTGFISHYRKLDNHYDDCLFMDLDL